VDAGTRCRGGGAILTGVKRSPELTPLSRDHHVALEHALRLRRTTDEDVCATVDRFLAFFTGDGERHFRQEEELLLPLVPLEAAEQGERMRSEHAEIRRRAALLADGADVAAAAELGTLLHDHVRFEERELFPLLEHVAPPGVLEQVGHVLARER
jgi:hypothetical protein